MPPKASPGAPAPRARRTAHRRHNPLYLLSNPAISAAVSVAAVAFCGASIAAPSPEPAPAPTGPVPAGPVSPATRPGGQAKPEPSTLVPRTLRQPQRVARLPELIDQALPGPYTLNLGLRGEWPEANPDQFGLGAELRWWLEAGAWLGVTASWLGGVNDVNPDDLLIAHRAELAATLGGRLPITAEVGVALGAKAGLMMVWGWPRGLLPDLYGELGPVLGGEVIVDLRLNPTWSIAPRVGLDTVRILQDWLVVLGAGLDLVWRFGR